MTARLQIKRGTTAQWTASTYILHDGQMGVDKDTGEIKLGDGVTPWVDLEVILSSQYVPMVGGMAPDAAKLNGQPASFYMPASRESDFMAAIAGASFLPVNGKAADSDKLDGIDSTGFVTIQQAAAVTSPLSPTRTLVNHFGSGSGGFPVIATNGVLPGDTWIRTDIGTNGSMWVYVGGSSGKNGWVHKGPIVCTSTTRPSTVTYTGLEIYETDTTRDLYWDGTKWRNAALGIDQNLNNANSVMSGAEFQVGMWKGFGNGSADMGVQITFPVAFASAPIAVFANPYGGRAGPAGYSPGSTTNWGGWYANVGEATTTTMMIRVHRTDGATLATNTDYYINWLAIGQK